MVRFGCRGLPFSRLADRILANASRSSGGGGGQQGQGGLLGNFLGGD